MKRGIWLLPRGSFADALDAIAAATQYEGPSTPEDLIAHVAHVAEVAGGTDTRAMRAALVEAEAAINRSARAVELAQSEIDRLTSENARLRGVIQ